MVGARRGIAANLLLLSGKEVQTEVDMGLREDLWRCAIAVPIGAWRKR